MAKDPLLRDAVKSIKGKIITAATSASPEDLAYLGTAIDRIGGRATVLEVEETGDIIMQELTDHGAAVEAATIASINATRDASQESITATKTAAETSITATKTAAVKTITDAKNDAVATTQAAAQNAISDSQAASYEAIARMQAVSNTVTSRLVYARKTFFYGQL